MSVTLRTRVFETTIDRKSGERKLIRVSGKYVKLKSGEYKLDAKGQKVKVKVKKPTYEYYLDIYNKGMKRQTKFLGIYLYPDDNKTTKIDKENQAKIICSKYETNFITGKFSLEDLTKSETYFIDYANHYLDTYTSKDIRKVQGALSHFKIHYQTKNIHRDKRQAEVDHIKKDRSKIKEPDLTLSQFNKGVAQGFIDYMKQYSGLRGETPLSYVKKIKSILQDAENSGYIEQSPFKGLSTKKIKEKETLIKKEMLTPSEVARLAQTPCSNEFIKRSFLFACFTGLGMAEIETLEWSQIDFENNRFTYHRAKTKVKAEFKMNQTIKGLLFGLDKKNPLVFGNYKIPSGTGLNKVIGTWVKRAGIKKHITFYCARHSYASMCLSKSKNLKLVSEVLGHSSPAYAALYAKTLEDEINDTMDSLDDIGVKAIF
jgi:integrase|tara:strand:+ start:14 stop:1300 length:1287 start_codon:yes stop_codon:yes gene_type:complete